MNHIENAAKLTLLTTLFFLVAGCEDGAGFSGRNSPDFGGPGGGSGQPPTPGQPLVFDQANAQDSAIMATILIEGMLQLTELGAQIIQTVDRRNEIQFSESCTGGGTAEYDFSDNDQNGTPSPGDSIRTTFRNCQLLSLNAAADGDFVISLEPPSPDYS